MTRVVVGRQVFNEVDHPPLFMVGDEVCLDPKQGFEIWAESAPFFGILGEDPQVSLSKSERVEIAMTKKYVVRVIEQRPDSLIWNIDNEKITGFAYKNIYLYWLDEIIGYKGDRREVIERMYGVPEPFLKRARPIEKHDSSTNQKTNSSWGLF